MRWKRQLAAAVTGLGAWFGPGAVRPLPFLRRGGRYGWAGLRADLRAASSVTLLAVPQSMAYAAIAGLPIVHGLACSAVAAIVAPLFSGSRHTILGPTNATAFLVFGFFAVHPGLAGRGAELVPLLVLMAGLFAVAGALLRLADLLHYVSQSVLVGYITGAAALIIVNQVRPMLGIAAVPGGDKTTFFGVLADLVRMLPTVQWVPALIGVCTIGIFLLLRKWRPGWPAFALSLVLASALFGCLIHGEIGPFRGVAVYRTFGMADLVPRVPAVFRPGVLQDISLLFGVAAAAAFLASLEHSVMSKALASRSGARQDPNQDMFGTGMANLAVSFAGGMVASGSPTRSILNFESGAAGRMSSVISGVQTLGVSLLIAAAAGWGVPLIDFVPKPALAALIICLSCSLFNWRHIRICLRSTRDDSVVLFGTLAATLLAPLHVAVFIGVAVSISLFLRRVSRPQLVEYEFGNDGELRQADGVRPIPAISIVHVEGELFFGAADLFRSQIQKTVSDPAIRVIVLRLKNARHLDATSVMALEDLIRHMRARGLHLIVSGATREVYRVLRNSGVLAVLQDGCDRKAGESNLFLGHARNPNLSTRAALKRAQQLLGGEKAEIRIFHKAVPEEGRP
jgi:SulP family sulfate permease